MSGEVSNTTLWSFSNLLYLELGYNICKRKFDLSGIEDSSGAKKELYVVNLWFNNRICLYNFWQELFKEIQDMSLVIGSLKDR